jgi:uncharacterized membrane protein YfcA
MIALPTAAALAAAILATSFLSGIFGMAGGMILLAILLAMMPLAPAMVLHGATQLVANGWRAWLWRAEIRWEIFVGYLIGAGLAALAFGLVSYTPAKSVTLVTIGVISLVGLWLPPRLAPNIAKRSHAIGVGALCTALHLIAGISGPILDVSFVRTDLDRRQLIATKAMVSTLGHLLKVLYFGQLLLSGEHSIAPAALVLAVVLAIVGTQLSRSALEAISDAQFRKWSRGLIIAIAAASLLQGVYLLGFNASASAATPPAQTRVSLH